MKLINPEHERFKTRPWKRKTESKSLCVLFRNDRRRTYLEKRLPVDVCVQHFGSINSLSQITGISRGSVYRAKITGWFNDAHTSRIEYCANGYLVPELTEEAQLIKLAGDRFKRSARSTEQHARKNRTEMLYNPIRFGLAEMKYTKFKRVVKGIDQPKKIRADKYARYLKK